MSHKKITQSFFAACVFALVGAPMEGQALGPLCKEIFSASEPAPSALRAQGARPIAQVATELGEEAEASLRSTGWRPAGGRKILPIWGWDSPAQVPRDYENSFGMILAQLGVVAKKGYFERVLSWRRQQALSTHVLDIFGSGFFIKHPLQPDSITGIRVDSYFGPDVLPAALRPFEIAGDALEPTTWAELDGSMRARSIPAFDLIAMRPLMAWDYSLGEKSMERAHFALKYIVAQALARLSPEGQFYFTIMSPVEPRQAYRVLRDVAQRIALETPYKLILLPVLGRDGEAYALTGALLPKALLE